MIICQLLLTAMARSVDADDEDAQPLSPFYLYIDECQNFITNAIADITSEAGKFRLYLTLAHQYMRQLRPEIRDAVLGNIGTTIGQDAKDRTTRAGDVRAAACRLTRRLNGHATFINSCDGY